MKPTIAHRRRATQKRSTPDDPDVRGLLLPWYDRHRRVLPWRALPGTAPDPYRVWVSEIMLQQTTVAAVVPYFHRFMETWPDVRALAAAPLDDVLRVWAGLGYYRRARFLHQAARIVCDEHGGRFPDHEAALRALPGCGDYTAAAIAAIAFDRSANVVDGNVERVMARLFAVRTPFPAAKAEVRRLAARLVPDRRAGDYAQALMDLGATVCVPGTPRCDVCPLTDRCRGYALGMAGQLPKRAALPPRPVRRTVAFVLFDSNGRVYVRQRPAEGLLPGMLEVPSLPWEERSAGHFEGMKAPLRIKADWRPVAGQVRHVFTHFELEIQVVTAELRTGQRVGKGFWLTSDMDGLRALPSVMRKIVRHAGSARD